MAELSEEQKAVVRQVKWDLFDISVVVAKMLTLYEANDWLNDAIDIQNVIPMSIDEWALELGAKVNELDAMLQEHPSIMHIIYFRDRPSISELGSVRQLADKYPDAIDIREA